VGRNRRGGQTRGLRLFFATDLHGSERCFRKFLNAADFYGVDQLILGGDMTGKLLVPIVKRGPASYRCQYGEQTYDDLDETGRRELEQVIRRYGHYPVVGSAEELAALEDAGKRDETFRRVIAAGIEDWVALAEERLRGTGRRCFVAPGNDDFLEIDAALRRSDTVVFAEGRCLQLDENHEMITTGYSNPTPWDTERELPEPELRARLDGMYESVRQKEGLVAVIHPPPFQSEIDMAPALSEHLEMKMDAGGVRMMHVGSTAVRDFLTDSQPLLALHGHVHEGRGTTKIGRTLCINPGSEYQEGILEGAIIELGPNGVISHQLVAG